MWWIWAVLAAVFITGEYFRNGSFLLWLGFASAVSCILSLLSTPPTGQIAVFINLSGILILLERRFKERYRFKTQEELDKSKVKSSQVEYGQNIFRKKGPVWEIVFNENTCTVKHSIGLSHIKNLLINQNQWITCTDLKNISSRTLDMETGPYNNMSNEQLSLENLNSFEDISPEEAIDKLSVGKIKELRNILHEKIEAGDFDDPESLMQNKNTLKFIEDYLKKNTNIHGRSRKITDRAESDRKAVSAAINRSRNNLKEHRELYTHFKSFIQARGNSFRYLPDRKIYWKTE